MSSNQPAMTVREACRRRQQLDGADAQALEHALTITERERDAAKAHVAAALAECERLVQNYDGSCSYVGDFQRRSRADAATAIAKVLRGEAP